MQHLERLHKKVKTSKFPNNPRIITEVLRNLNKGFLLKGISSLKIRFKAEHILVFIVSAVVMLAIGFSGSKLYTAMVVKSKLEAQRQTVAVEKQFWQGIIKTYPNYRDGYFRLATLEYELGNRSKAKEYLQKSLELDPNFEEGRKLEKILF